MRAGTEEMKAKATDREEWASTINSTEVRRGLQSQGSNK